MDVVGIFYGNLRPFGIFYGRLVWCGLICYILPILVFLDQ
jgi:hypothetical protein